MLSIIILSGLINFAISQAPGYLIIDPSNFQALSETEMACLWKTNIQINNSVNVVPWVFATRVFKSDGTVDLAGIRTLQNAKTAGRASGDDWFITPIMYPNPNGDPYAQISNLSQAITDAGFGWGDFDDTLYIAIEPGFWSQNKTANQQFLIDLAASMLHFMNFIGVYTSNSYWDQIVGADFNASIFFNGNDLPFLWWVNLNGQPDYSSWQSFGGFTRQFLFGHKYAINKNYCGTTIDLMWRQFDNTTESRMMRRNDNAARFENHGKNLKNFRKTQY